jgi:murein DD-endopeptidase MepM/ murein hydrolase activator NlpD
MLTIALCLISPQYAWTQQPQGPVSGHFDFKQTAPPISEEKRKAIENMLKENIIRLKQQGIQSKEQGAAPVNLQWPLKLAPGINDPGYHGVSGFVDHNPNYPDQIEDYNCGTRSYDLSSGYNHKGTDYFLWPFSWHKVDADEVWVVAAAPGVIIGRIDGNYDRNCGFGGGNWNAVYIQHSDGSIVYYGHLKKYSVTDKQVGDTVSTGEYLGVIGSSGNSTGPHLHFQLQDEQFNIIDPYAGDCNQITIHWADQRPYYDSAVNAVKTHFAPPVFNTCPQPAERNEQNRFEPGDRVYFVTYYRDQLAGQESQYTIFKPDGTVYYQWTHASDATHYAASYWYWYVDFPRDVIQGVWQFQVVYEGITSTHRFFIGHVQDVVPSLMLLLQVP